jgi:hypothetical protein
MFEANGFAASNCALRKSWVRNAWNLWSGRNQHFWNHVAQDSFRLVGLRSLSQTNAGCIL